MKTPESTPQLSVEAAPGLGVWFWLGCWVLFVHGDFLFAGIFCLLVWFLCVCPVVVFVAVFWLFGLVLVFILVTYTRYHLSARYTTDMSTLPVKRHLQSPQ